MSDPFTPKDGPALWALVRARWHPSYAHEITNAGELRHAMQKALGLSELPTNYLATVGAYPFVNQPALAIGIRQSPFALLFKSLDGVVQLAMHRPGHPGAAELFDRKEYRAAIDHCAEDLACNPPRWGSQ